jgi:hypothetical protein
MSEQASPKTIKSVSKEDKVNKTTTMYDVGFFELVWRNFFAGMSRAIGSIFVYILLMIFVTFVVYRTVFPYLKPYLNTFSDAIGTIDKMNQTTEKMEKSKGDLEGMINLDSLEGLF